LEASYFDSIRHDAFTLEGGPHFLSMDTIPM